MIFMQTFCNTCSDFHVEKTAEPILTNILTDPNLSLENKGLEKRYKCLSAGA